MKASGHARLGVCSCCGSVRLFGHEVTASVFAACWLGSVYACNRHLTTQTQQVTKEKCQRRCSVLLSASSLSSLLYCDNLMFSFWPCTIKCIVLTPGNVCVCDAFENESFCIHNVC